MSDPVSHILVIDDSPTFCRMVSGLLTKKNYRVTCAESAEESVKIFQQEQIDLVLTDIILPGMSGLNLLKLFKEKRPDIDVVIISSNASSFTAIKALRLGAYDYIVKPIDDEAILYNVVERTLEKRSLTRENQRLIADLSAKNHDLEEALAMMKAVNRLCALIASSLDIGDILRMLVESAVDRLQARKGYLLLLDRNSKIFSMKVSVGIDRKFAANFTLRHDQGLSGFVAANNKPLRINTDIPAALTQRLVEEDVSGDLFVTPGILSVPLRIKERVAGVVTISGRQGDRSFSDAEFEFVVTLANHAAIALGHAGTFYQLKKGS
jgi:DNA-binding response OmpR family regulator